MSQSFLADEPLVDLLVEQATAGLDPAAAAELEQRLLAYPGIGADAFAPAVAALALTTRRGAEPLPEALRARLLEQGARAIPTRIVPPTRLAPPARPLAWFAAAAAIVLAIAGWYPRLAAPPAARPDALRAALLFARPGLLRAQFTPTADPGGQGASGDVVWDPATQTGYLRLRRLAGNDPRQSQYQLWIFDAGRDDRYPVDGGVFDIPAGSAEVVVPIHARLAVGRPALFAVTIERPGGVVVSGREHIVVVAKPAPV